MIESAIQLIVERGVSATKLTDVGLKAGYSRGLAAMRFGTKAGLLSRVVRRGTENWVARVTTAVGRRSGLAAVFAAIDAQDRALTQSPLEMRSTYAIFFQSSDPSSDYHADVARTLAAQRRDLAQWLREARDRGEIPPEADPSRVGGQVLSAMLGIVYQWMMDPDLATHELHRGLREHITERFDSRSTVTARRRRASANRGAESFLSRSERRSTLRPGRAPR
jgi:AcrR family transcriptional regulator